MEGFAVNYIVQMHTAILFAVLLAFAAGDAAGGPQAQDAQRPPAAEKPSDSRSNVTGAPVDPKAYIIGPEDVLSIRVWREPENSGQFVVRPDGKIALPLIGEVQAAGLTPEGLRATVAEGLQKVLTHPEVTVGVERVNSKKYYIQGEINKPGAYPLVVPTTVLEALVNAGGFRDFANTKKITILRGSQTFKFNYKEVSKGKNMQQNIQLQPGDQIFVP
jgi:polysaccharide export outer membrane protein